MQWLNKLFDWFFQWVPQRFIVAPDEGGTRITLGKYAKEMGPGWYIGWPLIQELEIITKTPQVLRLPEQALETKDGKSIIISFAVQYYVSSPQKALLNVENYDEALAGLSMAAIANYVRNHSYEQCQDQEELSGNVRNQITEITGNWGLKIQKTYPLQFARGRILRVFLDMESTGRLIK